MYHKYRHQIFDNYKQARNYFLSNPDTLIKIETYIADMIGQIIHDNYEEISRDYNEANFLQPFWASYPPDNRGRAPVGDQIPWIEVGEHSVGHKINRFVSEKYKTAEIGLPSGADNRFMLESPEIEIMCQGLTKAVFVFLDIKSVGPRDNFNHTVISPYQVSGDGVWNNVDDNMENSVITAKGLHTSHLFHPAISPIYVLSNGLILPTIHIFVKPIYNMLHIQSNGGLGQPLDAIKVICVPNGLLLTKNPNYHSQYPGLLFPGKDAKSKAAMKVRCRVSFDILSSIADWRVKEFK